MVTLLSSKTCSIVLDHHSSVTDKPDCTNVVR